MHGVDREAPWIGGIVAVARERSGGGIQLHEARVDQTDVHRALTIVEKDASVFARQAIRTHRQGADQRTLRIQLARATVSRSHPEIPGLILVHRRHIQARKDIRVERGRLAARAVELVQPLRGADQQHPLRFGDRVHDDAVSPHDGVVGEGITRPVVAGEPQIGANP